MIVRAIDGSGDWLYGKSKNDYASNATAVGLFIAMRLRSFLGDCFFDLGAGIDWLNLLGAKNQLQLQLAISSMILNTPEVTSLVQLSLNLDRKLRALSIQYAVNTVYGVQSGTLQINPNNV